MSTQIDGWVRACAWCGRYWDHVKEEWVHYHPGRDDDKCTHTICSDCRVKHNAELMS